MIEFNNVDFHAYVWDSGNDWDQCLKCLGGEAAVVHWSKEKVEIHNQLERNGMI